MSARAAPPARSLTVAIGAGLHGRARGEAIVAAVEKEAHLTFDNLFFVSADGDAWTWREREARACLGVENIEVDLVPALPELLARDRAPWLPTVFGICARVGVFQPTRRPTYRAGQWIETAWGRCRVTGRLGQRHADALEAMLACGVAADGRAGEVIFDCDPYRVRNLLAGGSGAYSHTGLWRLVRELQGAVIEIELPDGRRALRSLLGGVDQLDVPRPTRAGLRGHPQRWRIRLGKAGQTLLGIRPVFWCLPETVAAIAALKSGVAQALARHILTHSPTRQPAGGWYLDSLIEVVAPGATGPELRKRRAEIRADREGLQALGVAIGGEADGRVFRLEPGQSVLHMPGAGR